jgi:hypothetical protein
MRRGKPLPPQGPAFDPDVPTAGFYRARLVRGGPFVALRFWLGLPFDPETGEELDRTPRWQCRLNGVELVDVFRFWPGCARDPISREEHDRLCDLHRTLDEASPYYDAKRPFDRLTAPLPFFSDRAKEV